MWYQASHKTSVIMLIFLMMILSRMVIIGGNPCDLEPGKSSLWCNLSAPITVRVNDLIHSMTLEEKAMLMTTFSHTIPRLNWPGRRWGNEALHGVLSLTNGTSWPSPIGIGATYNKTLFHSLGNLTSTEARAGGTRATTFWAPNINIFRDPRWGRGLETPGESPTLTGSYAEYFMQGMQGNNNKYLKVSACLKHLVAYGVETDRMEFGDVLNDRDMQDTYLPAFQQGVQKGNASGIMCSYNAETWGYGVMGAGSTRDHGGIPSCANKKLLTDTARKLWGFTGYITSDCWAVQNVAWDGKHGHNYTQTLPETLNATLGAGMDKDCSGYFNDTAVLDAVRNHHVPVSLIDDSLRHSLAVEFRLGAADPPELNPYNSIPKSTINCLAHRILAKEAASQSLVLLKNIKQALPLDKSKIKKIAVIGRFAKATNLLQGNYHNNNPPFLVSPCQGLKAYAAVTTCINGSDNSGGVFNGSATVNITDAIKATQKADAVILTVGNIVRWGDTKWFGDEGEGVDRSNIILTVNQNELIRNVSASANGKPVILIIFSGGPVDIEEFKSNSAVSGIIWAGYPGEQGGAAISDAIFGKTNRFGKLSQTWYNQSFCDAVKQTDFGMRPNTTSGNPGRGYRFYTDTPTYPFGYGLSYTTFQHHLRLFSSHDNNNNNNHNVIASLSLVLRTKDVRAEFDRVYQPHAGIHRPHLAAIVAKARVICTNIGKREGDQIILLFGVPPNAGIAGTPIRKLISFDRIRLAPGETKTIAFDILASDLALTDEAGNWQVTSGRWKVFVNHDHSSDTTLILQ